MTTTLGEQRDGHSARLAAWRALRLGASLVAAGVVAALGRGHASATQREVILGDALRAGWKPLATRNVEVRVADGVLLVRPNDRTRLFATAGLRAGSTAAIDARTCSYLTFEVNTLPGSAGSHRAPLLRVGLSDASGRTRFPLLSRFLQLDTDPTSWQQAFIPLDYLIDRGVQADAISTVMWQFAGTAAPFAVRRVALVGGTSDADAGADAHANLLADPSFETRADACAVWPLVGDYRDLSERGARTLERRGGAADGKRYLCLRGSNAFFFEALAPAADSVGFSVALRAPQEPDSTGAAPDARGRNQESARQGRKGSPESTPGRAAAANEVEIGCEVVGFGRGGGISAGGRAVRRVPLESVWRRYAVSGIVHLEDMPPDEAGLRLYRGWVRPLSPNAVVHVDAAHLSPAPVDAATFRPARANALAAGTGIYRQVRRLLSARYLTEDRDRPEPPRLQSDLPPFRVPLTAIEWAGRTWANAIASGGVLIPPGRVYSPDALRLRGPDGNDLPFQCDVLGRDPRDGSVRCLWVALRTPLGAGQAIHCTLESGATLPAQDLPVASETTDGVLLNTGLLRARLSRQRFVLFDEADWAGEVVAGGLGAIRLELLDGHILSSATPPTQVAVERNGPLNAVVVVRGFLSPANDEPAPRFRYEARLQAWRGVPGVQVNLAVTNFTPQPAVPVRSLALVVPLRRSSQVEASVGQENGAPITADLSQREWIRVTQRRDPFRSGLEDLYIEGSDTAPVVVPGRAAGWASWRASGRPPMTLAFGHMADRHPTALEVRTDSLCAFLLPPSGVNACDFPFGVTAYAEVWVGAVDSPEAALDRLQRPPLLAADRAYLAATGIFPELAPAEETRPHFPLLEWMLGREFSLVLGEQDRTGENGWLDDGGSAGGPRLGSADRVAPLYRHYLRTGDPRVWDRARREALHLREVDTWWANESSAFPNPPAAGIHTTYQSDLASVDATGLLYDYWLTGDARSLGVAEALSNALLLHAADSHLRGWERARMLADLARLYAATGRRVYREAILRQLAARGASETDLPAAGAMVVAAAEALDSLGGADLDARFRRELAALAASLEAAHPVAAVRGPEEASIYQGLSRAAPGQLPGTVWNAALQRLLWTFLAPHGQDISLVSALDILPAVAASGATPPAWAAGHALGLGSYSGQNRAFTLRIHRQANEPVSVTLCRMRAAHPDPSRRYRLRFMLRDPLKRVLESELLEGETFSTRNVTLPRRGLNGDYSLAIACEEDGLAEVVTTHPRVYLRADEWKASRFTQVSSRFVLRAPRRGDVVILLRGPVARGGGTLAAATLSVPADPGSKPGEEIHILSRARWSVPVVGSGADGRPAPQEFPAEGLRLSVPPEYRGKPLALSITTPLGVEWRVVGLDEPWLAATAAAFP